jgi:hypothetical protein
MDSQTAPFVLFAIPSSLHLTQAKLVFLVCYRRESKSLGQQHPQNHYMWFRNIFGDLDERRVDLIDPVVSGPLISNRKHTKQQMYECVISAKIWQRRLQESRLWKSHFKSKLKKSKASNENLSSTNK